MQIVKPSIGRIVVYKLSAQDCEQINRRRTDGISISERMKTTLSVLEADEGLADKIWPRGAQAHIGNLVVEGQALPMIITQVFIEGEPNTLSLPSSVNGQVFLDGNDVLWVRDAEQGNEIGMWHWPDRA
jgi:hypothetical protein